jgi:hypothetical protein
MPNRSQPEAMTLANIRANGVRTLAAWCLGRNCNHYRVLDVSGYPDDLAVPSFGSRLRCEHCGPASYRFRARARGIYRAGITNQFAYSIYFL